MCGVGDTPVLDVFPNDQEVRFDEPLDDLAVPLLPSRQLPGYRDGLEMDTTSESQQDRKDIRTCVFDVPTTSSRLTA